MNKNKQNKGMHSVQEFFSLAEWVEMGHFVYITFSFLLQKKSITFNIALLKPHLSKLRQVICGILTLVYKYCEQI